MLFDALAAIAEKVFPDLFPMVKDARLFIFPGPAEETISPQLTEEEIKFFEENFFLPFQIIAIEDHRSCVILMDQHKDTKGSSTRRGFIEIFSFNTDNEKTKKGFRKVEQEAHVENVFNPDTYGISVGFIEQFSLHLKTENIENTEFNYNYHCAGSMLKSGLATKNKCHVPLEAPTNTPTSNAYAQATLRNAAVAFQQVFYFNNPNRFILEKTPAKTKKKPRDNFIPRSHDRPIYTILTPNEIRKKLGLEESHTSHASPIAHERRRHVRVFKHPRFSKMQGKSIIVPASWIGPTEAQIKKSRYKVMTEI